jgi:hypothetical protein
MLILATSDDDAVKDETQPATNDQPKTVAVRPTSF